MTKPIIQINNLFFNYSNSNKLLENINIEILKKDMIAIIGPNGSGKSTLAKLIVGLEKPKKGEIKINGKVGYVPQKFSSDINFPATVSEILNLECCDCSNREQILESLDINKFSKKQFKELSGGQQQRVMIALCLLSNPDIIVLDEPSVGVDFKTQQEFYKILKRLNKENELTILFVTHETSMIPTHFNKIICFHENHVHVEDASKTSKVLKDIYGNSFNFISHNHGGKK